VIDFFKSCGLTVVGGVPTYWRTLINDAQSDPAWAAVYRSFDIISPWSVGSVKLSGCTMVYGAMFDEVDEGTAMYKLAPTTAQIPAQGSWVTLNIDGFSLPSDWYLRLAGQASKMIRGEIPLQRTIPITP
jgi:hypothetical protein